MSDFIVYGDRFATKGTLAHQLDKRAISYGEPTELDIPKTINPYELVMDILKPHIYMIRIKQEDIKNDLTFCLPLLQNLMPIGSILLVLKDLEPHTDVLLPTSIKEEVTVMDVVTLEDTIKQEAING